MHFDFVTIYTRDMDKSLAFCQELLGLSLLRRSAIENGEMAFLGVEGQPTIEIIAGPEHEKHDYSGFSLGIAVKSLDEATALLEKAGYPLERGPIAPGPGVRFSFFRDPDGIEIELIEHS